MFSHFYAVIIFIVVLVSSSPAEYGDRIKNATETWGPNLEMAESRYHGYAVPRPNNARTELPITFQAPYLNAKNYWDVPDRRTLFDYQPSFTPELITRPITEGINTFYGIMNQFFGNQEPVSPTRNRHQQSQQRAPYEFEYPNFQHKKPLHLPGPTPIRASVIKLEPARQPPPFPYHPIDPVTTEKYRPLYHPIDPVTTENYHPHFVKLLNDVLIENAYQNQDNFGSEAGSPVLEKPGSEFENFLPTTYHPNSLFKSTTQATQLPFPESIQDQLPPLKLGQDTRIPYILDSSTTETYQKDLASSTISGRRVVTPPTTVSFPDIPNSEEILLETSTIRKLADLPEPTTMPPSILRTTTTTDIPVIVTEGNELENLSKDENPTMVFPNQGQNSASQPQDIDGIIAPPLVLANQVQDSGRQPPDIDEIIAITPRNDKIITHTTTEAPITEDTAVETTTQAMEYPSTLKAPLLMEPSENRPVTELLQTVEELKRTRFPGPFPKKLHSTRVWTTTENSTDYVTELTLRGLTEKTVKNKSKLIPRTIRVVNMTVIGYEIGEKNIAPETHTQTPRPIDLDDELSLDARILKDTNWDGIQPQIFTESGQDTTTTSTTIEDGERTMASLFTTTVSPETTITTLGTTDIPTTMATPRVENHKALKVTHVTQTVSKSTRPQASIFARSQDAKTLDPAISPRRMDGVDISDSYSSVQLSGEVTTEETLRSIARRGRKYQRRPRVKSFTQYSPRDLDATTSSLQPTTSRPLYSRSKPNITLSTGNLKRMEEPSSVIPRRTIKSSRNELYKRRSFPSQLRRGTTEQTVEDADSR